SEAQFFPPRVFTPRGVLFRIYRLPLTDYRIGNWQLESVNYVSTPDTHKSLDNHKTYKSSDPAWRENHRTGFFLRLSEPNPARRQNLFQLGPSSGIHFHR